MATIAPWHATRGDVYHVTDECGKADIVDKRDQPSGTGGRPPCIDCLVLLLAELKAGRSQ